MKEKRVLGVNNRWRVKTSCHTTRLKWDVLKIARWITKLWKKREPCFGLFLRLVKNLQTIVERQEIIRYSHTHSMFYPSVRIISFYLSNRKSWNHRSKEATPPYLSVYITRCRLWEVWLPLLMSVLRFTVSWPKESNEVQNKGRPSLIVPITAVNSNSMDWW